MYCDFYDTKSYIYLSKEAISKLDTASLGSLYSMTDHVIIRMQLGNGKQQSVIVRQLDDYVEYYPLSLQINAFQGYSRPINADIRPYMFLGFVPDNVLGSIRGYKVGQTDLEFKSCQATPNNFIAFYANETFVKANSRYYW